MALAAVKDSETGKGKSGERENKNETNEIKIENTIPVPQIHYENRPELIWDNMQMIAFNNKVFLKLA